MSDGNERMTAAALAAVAMLCAAGPTLAQPQAAQASSPEAMPAPASAPETPRRRNFEAPATPGALQVENTHYSYQSFITPSRDGRRHYRIHVAVPKTPAPAGGYQVVYMADGDAAFSAIDAAMVERLAVSDAPVLVGVGYEGDRRFSTTERAYDYTPPSPDGAPVVDHANRPGGGADDFLDLVEQAVRPRVEAMTTINTRRQTLWGHSYGGLLTLHAAFTRPGAYHRFAAASPSLWWNYGFVLNEEPGFIARPRPDDLILNLWVGEVEQAGNPQQPAAPAPSPNARTMTAMRASVPAGSTGLLAHRLKAAGVDARYGVLPDETHGSMLKASLTRLLDDLSGAAPSPSDAQGVQ